MTKSTKLVLAAAALYWLFKRTGKGAIDSQIQSMFAAAGFNADNAKWWAAISRFETDNYTSTLALKYNNYFGMTSPGQTGVNLGKAGLTNFLSYASVADSINDAIAWVRMNNLSKSYGTLNSLIFAMSQGKDGSYYGSTDPNTYFLGVQADLVNI